MYKLLFSIVFLASFLTVITPLGGQEMVVEAPVSSRDSLTTALKQLQSSGQINGFGVAVVTAEELLYAEGFGWADVAAEQPYTAHTVQNIASISKTFIGLGLLKAQEMGLLDLDDPVSKYLDFTVQNPFFPEDEITIRQLATHTSSIQDGSRYDKVSYILEEEKAALPKATVVRGYFRPSSSRVEMGVLLERVLSLEGKWYRKKQYLKARPGTRFEYTNIGATLAAYVLEVAAGEKYSAFTTKHILEPLGMNNSGWSFEEVDRTMLSKLYAKPDAELARYSLVTYPDGGMITSAHDLGLYLQELMRGYQGKGTLLSQASYEQLFTPQLNDSHFEERNADWAYNDEYDFGVFIGLSAKKYIGHTGGDPGVSSFMFFHTEDGIGRLLMINTDLKDEEGVQQFFGIWKALGEFQGRL